MSLKAMSNRISGHYETADRFGSIRQSHQAAIEQIKQTHILNHPNVDILDFGVGDGTFLNQLKPFIPPAHFTGVDISAEMLNIAKHNIALTTIETTAIKASQFIPHHSQDLVLAHFINAYIPLNHLFREAHTLTKEGGHFSLITTTYDSYPDAQKRLADFISKETPLSRIIGHYYKAVVKNTTVAGGQAELLDTFARHHFTVVEHKRLYIPITFTNLNDLMIFGIEGTWFLNSLSIRMLPKNFLLQRVKRLFNKVFTFPYHDTHIIDVVLAKNCNPE